jgi:hypothetical protein
MGETIGARVARWRPAEMSSWEWKRVEGVVVEVDRRKRSGCEGILQVVINHDASCIPSVQSLQPPLCPLCPEGCCPYGESGVKMAWKMTCLSVLVVCLLSF